MNYWGIPIGHPDSASFTTRAILRFYSAILDGNIQPIWRRQFGPYAGPVIPPVILGGD